MPRTRARIVTIRVSVCLAVLLTTAAAWAQSYAVPGADRYFRVEWQASSAKRGPVISGYVYETFGRSADSLRLAIETLDPAGNATGSTLGYVNGTIPAGGRAYFEIPVPAASGYRVAVVSFRWQHVGGGI